jgi:hypothetical protein
MDEEDFLALIAILERQLRDIGAAELADARHYTWRDTETGDARMHDGRRRLQLMLEALDRKLAVEDRATYDAALGRINRTVRDGGLSNAIVETADGRLVSLSEAPDLSHVREDLQRLIGQILEAPPPAAGRA